ncbi:MAG: hypothetical protein L6R40_005108 [Gallowayella cf. fulva]|nr:MAG: hypothetical protein L6R40_005108 [Xanthomendoza cf. fulva]
MASIAEWFAKLPRNTQDSVQRLNFYGWLRLILVVVAYLLIRPWLMKLAERSQTAAHEKAAKSSAIAPKTPRAHAKAADGVGMEESTSSSWSWGPKARRRQKQAVDQTVEKEIMKAEEDDEEEDVEFLKRYCQ